MQRSVPDWVTDAVFYQIFPDRFRRGCEDWSTDPNAFADRSLCGGDLAGIRKSIPYLQKLGISALYLTPVFHAHAYHKYDTLDYYCIDPCFGDNEQFRSLVKSLHDCRIRVVLDGVFNHCSDRHPFFLDAVARGPASKYWHWFTVQGDSIQTDPEPNYARWAGVRSMPEWNHDNPDVVGYLLDVVRYWIDEFRIDGWRLDTTEYLPPDFVREIYRVARRNSPEIYILGEVMGLGTPWFRHQALDGVMHYRLWEGITEFFATQAWDAQVFWHSIYAHWHSYPEDANYGSYTLLSSHDRPRFLTACRGDVARLRLALAFQLTFPGAPAIYYGDEVGLHGADDPDNRRRFPWDPSRWNLALHEEVCSLISLRRGSDALRRGTLALHGAQGRTLSYLRSLPSEQILVALNADSDRTDDLRLPDGAWATFPGEEPAHGDQPLPPLSYRIYRRLGPSTP